MVLLRHRGFRLSVAVFVLAVAITAGARLLNGSPIDVAAADAAATEGAGYLQKARETGDPTYYGKAEAAFSAALRYDPQSVDGMIGKSSLALARHQFHDALALGEQAHAVAPDRALVYGVIGDAQVELGMYDDAAATMQAMIDRRPDLSSYSRASYIRELHGDIAGAIELMDQAVQSGSGSLENVEWVRVQLGNLYFNKGDLANAESQYQHALADLPTYGYALAGLAHVRAAQGRYDEAVALYNQAINRVPLPEFVIALGETQQAAGHAADAAQQYGLVRVIEQLFKANGVNTDMELALFEADHGDATQAVAQARTAYAERPNVKAADTLAWTLSQAGQQAEAQRYMTEALKLGSQDALFYYHAGMIAYRAGDMTGARARLSQALALNPYFSLIYAPLAQQTLAQAKSK
jgi:tetratricopeptide (TPR) repeat protein